jgi:Arm DNA-binding domain
VEKRLTAMQVARCATPGLYADGGGLYLQVTTGTDGLPRKSWLFRFSLHSRARHMGLGSFEQVSLAEARAARDKARAKVRTGIDPIEARNFPAKIPPNIPTFDECAAAYLKTHEMAWRSPKHRHQWPRSLVAYASPVFGALPVDAVDTGLVMRVLDPLWKSRPETATRVRGRIESVLAWATVRGSAPAPIRPNGETTSTSCYPRGGRSGRSGMWPR